MKPNILLVVLDATRADRCSGYGYHRPTTPFLDKLASEGTTFENAFAVAPWTMPSMASLLTGLYPSEHQVYETLRLSSSLPTLPEYLNTADYATMIATNNSWMSDTFGMTRGFQTVIKLWQLFQTGQDVTRVGLEQTGLKGSLFRRVVRQVTQGNPVQNAINALYGRFWRNRADYGAKRLNRVTRQWISGQEKPWFVLAHYLEAHLEYRPPRAERAKFVRHHDIARRLLSADQMRIMWRHVAGVQPLTELELQTWSDLYDAELNYQDKQLGELLTWLETSGRLDNTMLIVTADHGENLGDHGLLNHQYCLYDTLLRVPLIVRFPDAFAAGRRVQAPVMLLDVFATILDAAETVKPESGHGLNLANEAQLVERPHILAEYGAPRPPDETTLASYQIPRQALVPYEHALAAIRAGSYKLIAGSNGSLALYNWHTDPRESENVAASHSDLTETLAADLTACQARLISDNERPMKSSIADADPTVVARLRSLGYLD